jgi:hypothetical protein
MAHNKDNLPESLIHNSNNLFDSISSLVKEFIELAHLEAKLSCQNLIITAGLLFFSGMLLIAGWIALLIGAGIVLHDHGMNWALDCLIIFLVNIGLFSLCIGLLQYFFSNIGFPSTIKNLNLVRERAENEST